MIVLTAVDSRNGMLFHHRRQSQDRILRQKILSLCAGSCLWMNAYSARQFQTILTSSSQLPSSSQLKSSSQTDASKEQTDASKDYIDHIGTGSRVYRIQSPKQDVQKSVEIRVDDTFLEKAALGDFVFIENTPLLPYEKKIEKIILFQWNRNYPGDFFFDIPLQNGKWVLSHSEDFPGSSHKKITMEIYKKEGMNS